MLHSSINLLRGEFNGSIKFPPSIILKEAQMHQNSPESIYKGLHNNIQLGRSVPISALPST